MASGKGKTFRLGKMMINLSGRGIATKDTDTGEIRRYPFPWGQPANNQQEAHYNDDDQEYDENGYPVGDYDGDYDPDYDDPDYDEPEYDEETGEYYAPEDDDYDAPAGGILDEPWLMWAALVLLPPLGVWLLWRNNRYEITVRSAISAASIVWFVIMLIWLFSGHGGGSDTRTTPTPSPTATIAASFTPTPSPTPTATPGRPTATPSATPQTGVNPNTNPNPESTDAIVTATDAPSHVWSKIGGEHYHSKQNCGNMEGANRVTLATALNRNQTACPECMAVADTKPTATPLPANTYYSTPNGSNYHVLPNCRGMSSATVVTLAQALERGQTPCATCIGTVYITDGGANYHSNSSCRGMKNAYLTTVENAIEKGKTACATCMTGDGSNVVPSGTSTGDIYWYNPNGGSYYHKTSDCTGMKNAIKGSAAAAENNGKTPCPTCLGGTSANARYWMTTNGENYHSDQNCRGMKNATRVTEATAIARGKTACSTCIGGSSSGGSKVEVSTGSSSGSGSTTVVTSTSKFYSTETGANFHSDPNCRGMKGATEVSASEIEKRGQTPCSKCIGTSGTYYSTKTGDNYHSDPNCRGMKGASIVTLAMINARQQTPCPKCLAEKAESSGTVYYWATGSGKNYHSKSNCNGMKNATKVTEAEAEKRGQTPCPNCVGSVYATDSGANYHKDKNCQGMKGAKHITILAAEKRGQTACPKCIVGVTPTPKPTATPKPGEDDNDGGLYYYANPDGNYYHRERNCTGMKGAEKVSESTAKSRGQKPCPECIGSVYANPNGDYYHSYATCTGMKGAVLVTVDEAELRGQAPCPKCLGGDDDASSGGSSSGGNSSSGSDNVVTDPDNTMVYCTLTGKKYHSDKHCGGMRYASDVPLSWALEHNYRRCEDCDAPRAAN